MRYNKTDMTENAKKWENLESKMRSKNPNFNWNCCHCGISVKPYNVLCDGCRVKQQVQALKEGE